MSTSSAGDSTAGDEEGSQPTMQLKLKRRGDYSVRAMIAVARHDGDGLRRARQISSEMEIPYKFLTQILADLVGEGLLSATQGPAGGYRLGRPADEITLLDVVEAAEGPATIEHCVLRDGPCDWNETCPIHDTWSRAQSGLARELASASLADLAAIDAAIEAGDHQPETPPHRDSTARRGERH